MNFKTLSLAMALGLCSLTAQSLAHTHNDKNNSFVGSVKLKNYKEQMKMIQELDIDIAGVDRKNSIVDLLLTKEEVSKLEALGLHVEIDFSKLDRKGLDEDYKSPSEIEDILKNTEKNFSHIAKVHVIGHSSEGREIYALKISDNPELNEESEPAILFNSMHHAREVMSPEVSLDIIEQLTKNYNSDEKIKHYVNNNQIWIVPMLNVDGNQKVWDGSRMWRKNTNYGHGVDINRNYPYKWGTCRGSSGSTWSDTYRGPTAGSEPETQALMNLVKNIRPVFDISYHSYSEIVIYPMGCNGERAQTKDIIEPIGKEIGELIGYEAGTAWELLYSVDGSDIDWMYNEYQVIPYVIEVNSRAQGFQPSYAKWRDKTVERNRPAWLRLLSRLDGPGVRGTITSTENFQNATIEVTKLTGEKVQDYRVNPTGGFHIVLNKGEYKLTVKNKNEVLSVKTISIENERMNITL